MKNLRQALIVVAAAAGLVGAVVHAAEPRLSGDTGQVEVLPVDVQNLPAFKEVTGQVSLEKPLQARTVKIHDAVLKCEAGKPGRIDAYRVIWGGNVTFECGGANGSNGGDGQSYGGWCVGADQGNAEENFRNGGNEAGGNGGRGTAGTDGSSVTIRAGEHRFAPNTRITFNTAGGLGGVGGHGGRGKSKCMAPSGDDCRNGTNLYSCTSAPNGVDGPPGADGRNGTVRIYGDNASNVRPEIRVNGASSQLSNFQS